jgi:hypothetical protein
MAESKPKSPAPPTLQHYDDYWHALGEFIQAFAEVEAEMQLLIWHETGVTGDMARAIFSGFRIDQAKDLINRVRETKGSGEDQRLKRAFAQLTLITKARNDIVHFGAKFVGDGFTVSNELAAHVPNRLRQFEVSPTTLRAMRDDIATIRYAITVAGLEISLLGASPQEVEAQEPIVQMFKNFADDAWRYKPPLPPQPKTPRQPHPPAP